MLPKRKTEQAISFERRYPDKPEREPKVEDCVDQMNRAKRDLRVAWNEIRRMQGLEED